MGPYRAWDFPGGSEDKALVYNAGDLGSIPGSGRFPGEGNGNPLQYSCLENPMDRGAWYPWGHKESDMTERLHFYFTEPDTWRLIIISAVIILTLRWRSRPFDQVRNRYFTGCGNTHLYPHGFTAWLMRRLLALQRVITELLQTLI